MPIRAAILLCAGLSAGAGFAQGSDQPLSAIEWLSERAGIAQPAAQPLPAEPAVTTSATSPDISVVPLDGAARKRLGLLPFSVTGLKPDLWTGTAPDVLMPLLASAFTQRLSTGQELLLTALLAEADDLSPETDAVLWTAARIETLKTLGAVDPALAVLGQADPLTQPVFFKHWMDLALLSKTETAPCAALARTPSLDIDKATQIYCVARGGDFDTAALLFGTTAALGGLSDLHENLIARYLDPDLFGEDPMPRAPLRPDPLTFRLFEAAGAPLPTAPLPRAFAHFDMNADAGWKAQLEAAERLARAGVLPPNKLLGLYTDRKAAASGGIWDRVRALQAFDNALQQGDAAKISKTLPTIWRGMKAAGLEVTFAELFAVSLSPHTLDGPATDIAFHMMLLSRDYEQTAVPDTATDGQKFLVSLAKGAPVTALADTDMARATAAALGDDAAVSDDILTLTPDRSGEALLRVLTRLSDAGRGDLDALQHALTDLRGLGLEDFARRTALQSLILLDDG